MGKKTKTNQRMLQVSFGVGLIFLVLLIDLVAVHPSGIYSYSRDGFKNFRIGASRAAVLKEINRQKAIRIIRTCGPDQVFELTSRKGFVLEQGLAAAPVWICHDRTGKDFLFVFKADLLERIFLQRLRYWKKQGSLLFSQCDPGILKNIDAYLTLQEKLPVYSDTETKK